MGGGFLLFWCRDGFLAAGVYLLGCLRLSPGCLVIATCVSATRIVRLIMHAVTAAKSTRSVPNRCSSYVVAPTEHNKERQALTMVW